MRLLLFATLLLTLAGCRSEASESYEFRRGEFDPDRVPGIERIEAAAAEGDPEAQFEAAFLRHFMGGDPAAALPTFAVLAEDGHLGATKMLAFAYQTGAGVEIDLEQAAYWLERAAALGDEHAARDLEAYRAHQAKPARPSKKADAP